MGSKKRLHSTISTVKLKPLRALHPPPINLVFFQGSFPRQRRGTISNLRAGFPLEMLSAVILKKHSYPALPLIGTTGTPAVSSPRSSRTVGESLQKSKRMLWIESDIIVTCLGKRFLVFFCSPYHYEGPTISLTYFAVHHPAYGL